MQEPFLEITPPEGVLREPAQTGSFAVAELAGALFVVEMSHEPALARDRCRVLAYSFERPGWDTHFSQEVLGDGDVEPAAERPTVQCLRLPERGASEEALFVRLTSPLGGRTLRLQPGGKWEPVADLDPAVECRFDCSRLTELNGRLFGLLRNEAGNPGQISEYRPETGSWEPAALPVSETEAPAISDIVAVAGKLYAAAPNGERGFDLWCAEVSAAEPAWRLVLERGAWRYAHNREPFAMVPHGDDLYLIAGTDVAARRPKSKFFDYRGFEVIRIAPDGTWDLLIGTPRFSPNGLMIPLSGLGAGIDPGLGLEFRMCLSIDGRLLLGLHGVNGFQLWGSADGEAWEPLPLPALSEIHRVDACRAIPLNGRLALVLDTTEANGRQCTTIWAGRLGEKRGG